MTSDEARRSVGCYGKVKAAKGNYWYGQVKAVDHTGEFVLWEHGPRQRDKWYPSKDVELHSVPGLVMEHRVNV